MCIGERNILRLDLFLFFLNFCCFSGCFYDLFLFLFFILLILILSFKRGGDEGKAGGGQYHPEIVGSIVFMNMFLLYRRKWFWVDLSKTHECEMLERVHFRHFHARVRHFENENKIFLAYSYLYRIQYQPQYS